MTTAHLPPPVSELREVLRLLGFGTDQIPLQGMTTERQQTALLAKLNNHLLEVDQLNEAERYMLSTSPVADVTSGDGPASLAFAGTCCIGPVTWWPR
jgi:hypothetical protein